MREIEGSCKHCLNYDKEDERCNLIKIKIKNGFCTSSAFTTLDSWNYHSKAINMELRERDQRFKGHERHVE